MAHPICHRPSRVLYISYASPMNGRLGPARRHYHMVEQLSRFYDLHLLSIGTPSDAVALARRFGSRVSRATFVEPTRSAVPKHVRKLWRTLRGECDFLPAAEPVLRREARLLTSPARCDAVLLSSVLLRRLPLAGGVPVIADTHNAEFDVLRRTAASSDTWMRRQYATWQMAATRREERRCGRAVDLVLATSDRDRRLFEEELELPHVAVIPNGIDLGEFDPGETTPSPGAIVFSGLMSYYPNQQAVRWFLDEIFPLVLRRVPAARFVVAGAAPPGWLHARASDHVDVTGRVPDIRPYLRAASVVVVPLRIGGGTRVKILEAQAMRRPVVSTTIGAEGLGLSPGESILLEDDAHEFADRVVDLLTDASLAARITANAWAHAASHFNWSDIGERLSGVLQSSIGLTACSDPLPEGKAQVA
jgi:glycosyltransferase involved in cell wall biosynthesis